MQRFQLVPGAPRAALGAAGASALVVLVAPWVLQGRPAAGACALAFLVLLASTARVLTWRLRSSGAEREVWGKLRASLGAVAVGIAIAVVGGAAGLDEGLLTALLCLTLLVMMVLTYLGVVRWSRPARGGRGVDPDHVVNTVGAIAILVAVGQLLVHAASGGRTIAFGPTLPLVVSMAGGALVAGLLLVTTRGAWRSGDARPLLLLVALATGVVGSAVVVVLGVPLLPWATVPRAPWPLAVAVCAALPAAPRRPEREDLVLSTVGGYVTTAAGLPVAVLAAVQGLPGVAVLAVVGTVGAATRLLVDVRELRQLLDHRRAALTDELTGLPNRRAVTVALEEVLAARRECVVAVLDLDGFKEVNDTLGHAAGDALLRAVAVRVAAVLRPGEVVARLGGDEFVVVAPCPADTAVERAAVLGRDVVAAVGAPVTVDGAAVQVGTSIGTVAWAPSSAPPPAGAGDVGRLLHAADAAMYDAKRTGAGWVAHDPLRHDDDAERLRLVAELRTALAEGQLVQHFQPQVSLLTGEPVGVEALVRWQHPRLGLLSPASFLELAEVHGLMGLLTEEVLRLGAEQHAVWRAAGVRVRVAVNLSGGALRDVELPSRLAALLERSGVEPCDVVLEVRESVLLDDPARGAAVVASLRALGVRVSIDDFGTGHASLAALQHLPLDQLKLDGAFTRDLLDDGRARTIVASTVALAHALGLSVVAEGVESRSAAEALAGLGCDEAQGYWFAAPLAADEVLTWWSARAGARGDRVDHRGGGDSAASAVPTPSA